MTELTDQAGMIFDGDMKIISDSLTMRELLLQSWRSEEDTQQIMRLTGLTEDQVCQVIPKSLWVYTSRRDCPKCRGKGYFTHVITAPIKIVVSPMETSE